MNTRLPSEPINELVEVARTLATAAEHWQTRPTPAELAGAETMLVGMHRLVTELRGGPNHAA